MALVKLTEKLLSKPVRKRTQLCDSGAQGLRARGSGRGWVFYYQGSRRLGVAGKVERPAIRLGDWSPVEGLGMSIEEARLRALELARQEPETATPGETVRAIAEDFLKTRYPENEVRREKVRALLENHALPSLGGLGSRQVTRQRCSEVVKEARRSGGRAPAVELIRVLRQLFRHAVKTGRLKTLADSPAELLEPRDFGITAGEPRERWLSAEELKTLFLHKEVDLPGLLAGKPGLEFGLSRSVRAAIILGPHLAVRPKALVGLRWDEVDLDNATATIRGGRGAKQRFGTRGKAFAVPLSTTAVAVLKVLEASRGESPWVFPSASSTGHLSGDVLADAMLRLRARLELPGGPVRPHDARRTFANTAINLKVDRLVVERCLQHSLGKVGDTYLGDTVEQLRRSAHELVDAHWTAIRTATPAKVMTLRAGR
jgi:integrase